MAPTPLQLVVEHTGLVLHLDCTGRPGVFAWASDAVRNAPLEITRESPNAALGSGRQGDPIGHRR